MQTLHVNINREVTSILRIVKKKENDFNSMFPQCLLEIVFGSSLSLDFHLISTEVILFLAQYELETFMCSLICVLYVTSHN